VSFPLGLLIGFVVQMPIGPTAFLCFRRFTSGGAALAIATGLGTALGDTVYAGVAVAGLRGLRAFVTGHEPLLRLLGALVLIALGILIAVRREEGNEERALSPGNLLGAFGSTLTIALLNPATIAVVAGGMSVFGAYHAVTTEGEAWIFTLGFLLGAAVWWVVFAELTARLQRRLGVKALRLCSRLSGVVIASAGAVFLFSTIFPMR
jgi:threonine/homoserine/homoserine lactone efflux protein